jgi:hypothetical protein
MASGDFDTRVMQCHCTPDGPDAKVCVGFAAKVGGESFGFRLAQILKMIDPVEDDGDLLDTVNEVIERHNTGRGLACNPPQE